VPHRYRQRDGILPQRRHPALRAEEAGRLSLLARLAGRARAPDADRERLAAAGAAARARLLANPRAVPHGRHKADLFAIPGFVSGQRCRELIALIESEAVASTLFGDAPRPGGVRTSSTHFFRDHPRALELGARIDALLGIGRAHAEPLQGQRYRAGEEYRHHCDHFRQDRDHWQRERLRGGQRTWTAMLYLNAVEGGGETDFSRLGLAFTPEPGLLLVWNNMDRQGRPNRDTLHAGLPVERGTKYIVTQWYRLDPWRALAGAG
jgi:prolyl 4-hydroxylase